MITLQQYSEYVKLPIEALEKLGKKEGDWYGKPALLSDYRDEHDRHVSYGYRLGLDPKVFTRTPDKSTSPYLLQKLSEAKIKDYLTLVEGESDAEILSYMDIPVLGIAGANSWKPEYDKYLVGFKTICVIIEPDKGGRTLKEALQKSAHADRITFVSLEPHKDIRDLWLSNPNADSFKQALRHAVIRGSKKVNKSPEDTYLLTEDKSMRVRAESVTVPHFPLHVFSEPIQEFIKAGSEGADAPPDFMAVPLLSYAGGVIGKTARLQLKKDWVEYPCLWTVIVGERSTGKSPALRLVRKSVEQLQRDAEGSYEVALGNYDHDLEEWNSTSSIKNTQPKPVPPTFEHFMTTDATMEALAPMLKFSSGIVYSSDEILSWLGSMDKYNKGRSDKQLYMTLYNSDLLKIDRKSQTDTIIIDTPVVTIVGGTQPAVIPDAKQIWQVHDGFAERILWSYPATNVLGRWHDEDPIDRTYIDQVFSKLRQDPQQTLILSDDAKPVWTDWYNATKLKVHNMPESDSRKAILGKAYGQVARIALILHLVNEQTGFEISADTLRGAIEVMDYFVDHSQKVWAQASQVTFNLKDKITELLQDGTATKSDILQACKNQAKKEEVDQALDELVNAKNIEVKVSPTGGKPVTEYRLVERSFSV